MTVNPRLLVICEGVCWNRPAVEAHALIVMTAAEAAQVAGASVRQVGHWNRRGLFQPSVSNEPGAYGKLYSFRDLVGLRTIAKLRAQGIPLQQLRRFDAWLKERYETPWSSLRFEVRGRELVFLDPDSGATISAQPAGQVVLRFRMTQLAEETDAEIRRLRERKPEQFGQVTRTRGVLGGVWRLAGTRVPTSAIRSLHDAGYSDDDILRSYPGLVRADIAAALAHERSARSSGRRAS
jgi:uncharacterized protein (DUF433 family)